MKKILRIVSRNSELALWQAHHVGKLIIKNSPNLTIEIIGITTQGDQILDRSLDKIGGKGLFIKELEHYLLNDKADIAVHSAKDLPATTPSGLCISGFLARSSPNDVILSNKYKSIDDMPIGAIIGTSSSRRSAILRKHYPHLTVKLLRGNLNTRIAKLKQGEFDAIILAEAGVVRLGLNFEIKQRLPINIFVPAIGQGALAIEMKSNSEFTKILSKLYCAQTINEVGLERKVGAMINADCSTPIGCYAKMINSENYEINIFTSLENQPYKQFSYSGSILELEKLEHLVKVNL